MRKPVPVFSGAVGADGKLHLDARGLLTRYLATLKNKPVQVIVRVAQRAKSRSQLGYLWGVVYPVIAEDLGYAAYELDALHDALIRKLRGLKPEPNPLGLRVSLAEMPHDEVSDYISDVRMFAATELGIVTPDAEHAEPARRVA